MSVYSDLIAASVITEYDVGVSNNDGVITGGGNLHGGDGDDTYVGTDGLYDRFFFDGRDDNNDEGRHVNVVQNFELGFDVLGFRLDGGFFKDAEGVKMAQSSNGNVAHFSTARDIADLMLHINTTTDDNADDDSFVQVVNGHLVFNFDDGDHSGEGFDKWGNYKTNDVMVVFENFEKTLASTFANEVGYAGEFASAHDSIHIADSDYGGTLSGGDGDNLFILSDAVDRVSIQRGFNNNDEGKHVNIIHGFDLSEDKLSFDTDYTGLFTAGATTSNGKYATFEGADGLLALLNVPTVTDIDDSTGDLHFDIDLHFAGPVTVVLTDTTLAEVQVAAAETIWAELTAAGVFPVGSIPPAPGGNGDGIIGTSDNKGDDIMLGTAGADTFWFDSRAGAEDGTQGTNDRDAHVNVIVGFQSNDSLGFRIDGGYFDGFAFKTLNNNQANVGYDDIAALGAWINDKDPQNAAFYDAVTNSTILTIDDSPSVPGSGDEVTIVLWDSGDLL